MSQSKLATPVQVGQLVFQYAIDPSNRKSTSSEGGPREAMRDQINSSGDPRWEYITNLVSRNKSRSKQIKQLKLDLLRLYLTTGTHGALLLISPAFRVHKIATAGDYNTFLQMYAAALAAQKKRKRRDVLFRMDHLWERCQARGGLAQIEGLCLVLLKEGCDEDLVENFKDAYLAALVSHEDTMHVRSNLSPRLNRVLREFIFDCNSN